VSVATHGVLGHPGPWTVADVEALPDVGDHVRYELLSPGVLTVSPAPGTAHQRISTPRPGSRRTGDWSSNPRHT
jgi:hypothetical protein